MVPTGTLLSICLWATCAAAHETDPGQDVPLEAPPKSILTQGRGFSLPGLVQSRVEYTPDDSDLVEYTVIMFLHSGCPASATEYKSLDELSKSMRVRVIAVARGSLLQLRELDGRHQFTFPVAVDSAGVVFDAWDVDLYPTTFLLGKGGQVESVEIGSGSVALVMERASLLGSPADTAGASITTLSH